nr:hypothetical protein [uncultured Fluviicola sp.]
MKKLSLLTLFAVLVFAGLNSCSKERKIEKNLYSKGGDWDVSQYIYASGSMNPAINSYSTATFQDCGKFHFSKDGSGTVSMNLDGDSYTESFFYKNTDNKLTITFDTYTQVYNLDWSKNVITINYDESTTDPDGYAEIDRENIVMAKK